MSVVVSFAGALIVAAAFAADVNAVENRPFPSPVWCVRACPLGKASQKRLWNGIPPAVRNWELADRAAVASRLEGIAIHSNLPSGATAVRPVPVFLLPPAPDGMAMPTNALVAHGYAVVRWTSRKGVADPDSLAWVCSRVMDWIGTQPELDASRVAIVGCGDAASSVLRAAALDERFALAVACGWKGIDPDDAADLLRLLAPRLAFVSSCDPALAKIVKPARSLYAAYRLPDRLECVAEAADRALDWNRPLAFADRLLKAPPADDSEAVEARLRAAIADGSRTLTLGRNPASPDGVWRLVRAILVPDDFTLIFDGCRVEQPFGTQDNFVRNAGAAEGACVPNHGIRILGRNGATLSAGKRNSYLPKRSGDPNGWRAVGILLCDVSDYEIGGLRFEETQCWAISQERCHHGRVHDIVFGSTDVFYNQDGVDVRKGCHDLVIEDISGSAGDDAVALTAYRNPPGVAPTYGMQIGGNACLGDADDVYNVTIRRITAKSAGGHGVIRLLVCDGIKMHHVSIEDVHDTATGSDRRPQATIRIGDVSYHKTRRCAMGEMHHISVKGVRASGPIAVWLKGPLCDSEVIGITPGPNGRRYDITAPFERVKFDPE